MTLSQEIILYFFILPMLAFILYAIVRSYIEDIQVFKSKIWQLRKAYRKQNEEYEKQEFLWKIKNGFKEMI